MLGTILMKFCSPMVMEVEFLPTLGRILVQHNLPRVHMNDSFLGSILAITTFNANVSRGIVTSDNVDQALLSLDELLRQLKKNLKTTTNRMKEIADRKRRNVEFQKGDIAYLKLQSYR